MHDFSELIQRTTIFSLDTLNNIQKNTLDNFETNAKTPDAKNSTNDSITKSDNICRNVFNV
jgi:hypothetical protein